MKRTIIQCDRCGKSYGIPQSMGTEEWYSLRSGWITLVHSPLPDLHFCSPECLAKSVGAMVEDGLIDTTDPNFAKNFKGFTSADAPQSTMRRFLLVDGETADEFEGVKWSNGAVSVNVGDGRPSTLRFNDWEQLKKMNPGSGITWIDQEVSGE